MVFGWENSIGGLAFLSIVPLILLYIVKPRPRELEVPSLMFFMKSKTHHAKQSFFQRLIKNWLFLVQLLILLLLSLYFVDPYTTLGGSVFTEHAILIVDTSASTQANNNQVFKDIIAEAKGHLGKTNTIVIISNTPRTGVKEANKNDAKKYLDRLQPTDSRSSLGEAILLAEKHIVSENDKVFVISDFLTTSTVDVAAAKQVLASKGVAVSFIPVASQRNVANIGITDLIVGREESVLQITNFNDAAVKVPFRIGGVEEELVVDAKNSESHSFPTPEVATTIALATADEFASDNTAYLVLPQEKQVEVLLISDQESLYLTAALRSSPAISVDVTGSGSFIEGYDVYLVAGVRELSKSLVKKLEQSVEQGAQIILHVQTESLEFDYGSLLPFTFTTVNGQTAVTVEHINKFTKGVSFGSVNRYYPPSSQEGVVIATAEGHPILSLHPRESGTIVYYGILEKESEFKFSPSYPIFWTNLVKYLAQAEDIEDVNVPTGSILALPKEETVTTPSGTFVTDILIFEEQGIYSFADKVYAASLVSVLESDLTAAPVLAEGVAGEGENATQSIKQSLSSLTLILACILLLVELLMTKFRGEL